MLVTLYSHTSFLPWQDPGAGRGSLPPRGGKVRMGEMPPHPDTSPFPRPRHPRYPLPMQHQLNRHRRQRICQKRGKKCSGRSANTYKTHSTWTTRVVSVEGVFVGDSLPSMKRQLLARQFPTVGAPAGPARPKAGGGNRPYSSEAAFRGVTQPGSLPIGAFKTIQDNIRSLAAKRTGAYGSTSTSTSSPSTLTGNTCSPCGAGPMTTSPVMTSNIAPCSAHITSLPSR